MSACGPIVSELNITKEKLSFHILSKRIQIENSVGNFPTVKLPDSKNIQLSCISFSLWVFRFWYGEFSHLSIFVLGPHFWWKQFLVQLWPIWCYEQWIVKHSKMLVGLKFNHFKFKHQKNQLLELHWKVFKKQKLKLKWRNKLLFTFLFAHNVLIIHFYILFSVPFILMVWRHKKIVSIILKIVIF